MVADKGQVVILPLLRGLEEVEVRGQPGRNTGDDVA
jgi:hypothetical protein